MASKATHASLWLPGFDFEAPAYPDLFGPTDEAAAPAANTQAEASEPATADAACNLPRLWRPAMVPSTQQVADIQAIT